MSFFALTVFSGIFGLHSAHNSYIKKRCIKINNKLKEQCINVNNKLKENLPKYLKSDQIIRRYGNIIEIDDTVLKEILNSDSKNWFEIINNYLIAYTLSTLDIYNNVEMIFCYSGIYGSPITNI